MNRHSPAPAPRTLGLRLAGLLLVLLGGCEVVRRLALAPVLDVVGDPAGRAVDDLVAAGCGGALMLCWLWIVVCVLAVTIEALRGLAEHSRTTVARASESLPAVELSTRAPRIIAVTVLAVLGLGYGAAPALAGPGSGPPAGSVVAGRTVGPVLEPDGTPGPPPVADRASDTGSDGSGLIGGLPLPDRVSAFPSGEPLPTDEGPTAPTGQLEEDNEPAPPTRSRTFQQADRPTAAAETSPAPPADGSTTESSGHRTRARTTDPSRARADDPHRSPDSVDAGRPAPDAGRPSGRHTAGPTRAPSPLSSSAAAIAGPTGPEGAENHPSPALDASGTRQPRAGTAGRAVPRAGELPRVVVRPGDSLWSIAAAALPPDAPPAAVDRAWRRIADANASVLGDEPDLIFPGTALVVPDLDPDLGKDRP